MTTIGQLSLIKTIFISLILMISYTSHAQIEVYRTYEDFQRGISEQFETYSGAMRSGSKVTLRFQNKDGKTNIKCKEVWGFRYKDALFRNDVEVGQPTRVMISGNIIYYENGIAHMDMIRYNKKEVEFSLGSYCYLSKDLNSKMIAVNREDINYEKNIKEFKQQFPEFEELFNCIEKYSIPEKVSSCVNLYSEESE